MLHQAASTSAVTAILKLSDLPCRPGPVPVFCSPVLPLDILSAYRTSPVQNKQVRDTRQLL